VNEQTAKSYDIKIDLHGLIRLLAKNLYSETDVFVRELLQNSHDAVQRRIDLEGDNAPAGVIRIRANRNDGTITFSDNGAGLTEEEVHSYLSTIGRSGTDEFRQKLMREGRQADISLIGQFGIGLLSAFVVAHTVIVETLSCAEGNPSWRWESRGDKDYTLGPGARREPGTTVTLYVNIEKYADVLLPDDLRKAIRKYADFLAFPIYLNDEGTPVNAINAPWHKSYSSENEELEDMVVFVNRRFPDYPLAVIPVHIIDPYHVNGVLYISDRRVLQISLPGLVDIYQSRMFISASNRDLLPSWANFVRGVIDSPDLTPTAARDSVQRDGVFNAIRDELGKVIVNAMKKMSREDTRRFEQIMGWHSFSIKAMAVAVDDFFDAIADLVPFETNEGPMNLVQYFSRSAVAKSSGNERNLFYFSESGSSTQFYILCDAKGLLVVNASIAFETDFLEKYARRHPDIRLHQIDIAGSEFIFEPLTEAEHEQFRQLESDYRRIFPDARSYAKVVHFRPITLPAVTTLAGGVKLRERLKATRDNPVLPREIRDLVSEVLQERQTVPVILYLNADNLTIQRLVKMNPYSEEAEDARGSIYNNALMLAQQLLTPESAELMFRGFNRVIDKMITQTIEIQDLQRKLAAAQFELREREPDNANTLLTEHVSCFVALPFKETYNMLFQALRALLENKPYFWQILRADELHLAENISGSVEQHIARAHCYVAEISDGNPNVFLELGMMKIYRRPTILLRRQGVTTEYADIKGAIYLSYPVQEDNKISFEDLVVALGEEFEKNSSIKELHGSAHYLSPILLHQDWIPERVARLLSKEYITVENFVAQAPDQAARQIGLARGGTIADIQDYLRTVCEL
jgi:molecular chaperone HtpG